SPDVFPMRLTWLTGTMTRSEMEHEHPLELEQLDKLEANRLTQAATKAKEQLPTDAETARPSGPVEEAEKPSENVDNPPPSLPDE
ncbi:MAG TPA: hypothetical protein VNJ09_05240, partial [Chthonomonadales bacterium]|nr:hypothetical protein [Chthonomonadales bacterium]